VDTRQFEKATAATTTTAAATTVIEFNYLHFIDNYCILESF